MPCGPKQLRLAQPQPAADLVAAAAACRDAGPLAAGRAPRAAPAGAAVLAALPRQLLHGGVLWLLLLGRGRRGRSSPCRRRCCRGGCLHSFQLAAELAVLGPQEHQLLLLLVRQLLLGNQLGARLLQVAAAAAGRVTTQLERETLRTAQETVQQYCSATAEHEAVRTPSTTTNSHTKPPITCRAPLTSLSACPAAASWRDSSSACPRQCSAVAACCASASENTAACCATWAAAASATS